MPATVVRGVIYSGHGAPTGNIGLPLDYYLDLDTYNFYGPKINISDWDGANVTSLIGPQGEQGITGATGPTGPAGTTWHSGAGVPSGGLGANGDYYLDTSSGDVYTKTSSSWGGPIENLIGPTGPQGEKGDTGDQGPTGATGATGPQGAAGADGTSFVWSGIWDSSTSYVTNDVVQGSDGSAYIAVQNNIDHDPTTDTDHVYWDNIVIHGATGPTGATGPVGPQGETGATGTAGSKWYEGSGVPSSGLGANGDFYLNTANGDVYTKSAGSWGSPVDNLTGPEGDLNTTHDFLLTGDGSLPAAPGTAGIGLGVESDNGNPHIELVAPDNGTPYIDFTTPGVDSKARISYEDSGGNFKLATASALIDLGGSTVQIYGSSTSLTINSDGAQLTGVLDSVGIVSSPPSGASFTADSSNGATEAVDADNLPIINLADPTNPTDAVTKEYVDNIGDTSAIVFAIALG